MKFSCPFCDQHLEADEEMEGVETACPSCDRKLVVPQAPARRDAPRQAETNAETRAPYTLSEADLVPETDDSGGSLPGERGGRVPPPA